MEAEQSTQLHEETTPIHEETTPIQEETRKVEFYDRINPIFTNWWFMFIYAFAFGSAKTNIESPGLMLNDFASFFPYSLGGGLVLLIIPSIIAGIHRLSVKKRSTNGMFFAYFVIITVGFLLALFGIIYTRHLQSTYLGN